MVARIFLMLILVCPSAVGAEDHKVDVFRKIAKGHVAFCRPSEVDELQIIGGPRNLSREEVRKLVALLSAEDTWYERQPDGTLRGMLSFCIPHYDFKFLLSGEHDTTIAIRLCTSCRQMAVVVDGRGLKLPNLRKPAMEALGQMFEGWFPGWAAITYKNQVQWETRQRPNKAPEPTTTAVTSPAAQEPRQP